MSTTMRPRGMSLTGIPKEVTAPAPQPVLRPPAPEREPLPASAPEAA